MKKILLSIAMLGLASAAFAQDDELMEFTDLFNVVYDGHNVAENSTIAATEFVDMSDIYMEPVGNYEMSIDLVNLGGTSQWILAMLKPYEPTMAEYKANPFFYGDPALCFETHNPTNGSVTGGSCLGGDKDNLLNPTFGNGVAKVPAPSVELFNWAIHVYGCDKESKAKYVLTMQAVEVEDPVMPEKNYFPISYPYNIILDFSSAADARVDGINRDDAEGIYFDLQGRRVENPEKGIYIYKTHGKTVKKVIK